MPASSNNLTQPPSDPVLRPRRAAERQDHRPCSQRYRAQRPCANSTAHPPSVMRLNAVSPCRGRMLTPCRRRRSIHLLNSGAACFVRGKTRPLVPTNVSMPQPLRPRAEITRRKISQQPFPAPLCIAIPRRENSPPAPSASGSARRAPPREISVPPRACDPPASSAVRRLRSAPPPASRPARRPRPRHRTSPQPYSCYRPEYPVFPQARDSMPHRKAPYAVQ